MFVFYLCVDLSSIMLVIPFHSLSDIGCLCRGLGNLEWALIVNFKWSYVYFSYLFPDSSAWSFSCLFLRAIFCCFCQNWVQVIERSSLLLIWVFNCSFWEPCTTWMEFSGILKVFFSHIYIMLPTNLIVYGLYVL